MTKLSGPLFIVEDDPELSDFLVKGLKDLGQSEPRIFTSGEEAILAGQKTPPALVIMDIKLAGALDGFETATRLQALGPFALVFLTGQNDPEALAKARASRASAYLKKPVQFTDLALALGLARDQAAREEELRGLYQDQQFLFDHAPIALALVKAGTILRLNREWARMAGKTPEELIGKNFTQAVDLSRLMDQSLSFPDIRATLSRGETVHFDPRVNLPDGSSRYLSVQAKAIPPLCPDSNRAGEYPGRSLWIVSDRTRERELQAHLTEQERHNRELVDHTPVGILSIKGDHVVYGNPAARRLLGYDSGEFLSGTPLSHFFHAGEADVLKRLLEGDATGGSPVEAQLTTTHDRRYVVEIQQVRTGIGDQLLFLTDITEKKRAESRAGYLAYYDPLSGLPNRKLLLYRLELEMIRALDTRKWILLVLVGLDRFGQLNESHGHDVGDRLLLAVGERMKTLLGPDDTLARVGGDTFAILMGTGVDQTQVHWVVHSVSNLFEKPYLVGGQEVSLTASLGVTVHPQDASDAAELFRCADFALKQAKSLGRGQAQFYDKILSRRIHRLSALEGELREALARHEFALHFQPQVDHSGVLVGAECLLRWNSGREGSVTPTEFIPIIEENRQIIPVGYWVLEEACRALSIWQQQGLTPVRLGVNLSVYQFHDTDLVRRLKGIIEQAGVNPALIELEITESGMMSEQAGLQEHLRALRNFGVRLALDDFGSGYSSFSKLLHLPLDVLKLDKSFVQPVDTETDARKVVKAMIQLGQTLNLEVLAEGVENARQCETLFRMGCQVIQGYYFSRPLPFKDFTEVLRRGRIEGAGYGEDISYIPG